MRTLLAIVLLATIGTGGFLLLQSARGWQSEAQMAAAMTRTDGRALLAVVAIRAIEEAMALDPSFSRLDGVLESLRKMRDQPADALMHTGDLGFMRWLSGDWNLETWGDAGPRILAAINALESFHDRWRAASRTRLIAV